MLRGEARLDALVCVSDRRRRTALRASSTGYLPSNEGLTVAVALADVDGDDGRATADPPGQDHPRTFWFAEAFEADAAHRRRRRGAAGALRRAHRSHAVAIRSRPACHRRADRHRVRRAASSASELVPLFADETRRRSSSSRRTASGPGSSACCATRSPTPVTSRRRSSTSRCAAISASRRSPTTTATSMTTASCACPRTAGSSTTRATS